MWLNVSAHMSQHGAQPCAAVEAGVCVVLHSPGGADMLFALCQPYAMACPSFCPLFSQRVFAFGCSWQYWLRLNSSLQLCSSNRLFSVEKRMLWGDLPVPKGAPRDLERLVTRAWSEQTEG